MAVTSLSFFNGKFESDKFESGKFESGKLEGGKVESGTRPVQSGRHHSVN